MTLIQFKHSAKCYRVRKLIYVFYQNQILVFGQDNMFLYVEKLGLFGLFCKTFWTKILIFLPNLKCYYSSLPVDAAILFTAVSRYVYMSAWS